jgi:hypothetical protein
MKFLLLSFIRCIARVLQYMDADHQANGLSASTQQAVVGRKSLLQSISSNESGGAQ